MCETFNIGLTSLLREIIGLKSNFFVFHSDVDKEDRYNFKECVDVLDVIRETEVKPVSKM